MTEDWTKILFSKLQNLQSENAGIIDMNSLDAVIKQFLEVISNHVNDEKEKEIYRQIEMLSAQIFSLKRDMSNISEESLSDNFIPEINMELLSVVAHTERYVIKILESADQISHICSKITDEKLRQELMVSAVTIIENCNFQDLTGQRIDRIINKLTEIESVIYKMLHALRPEKHLRTRIYSKEHHLLNGPQHEEKTPSQCDIDDLFNNC